LAKGKLFEYAVLYHPKATKAQIDAGDTPKSVLVTHPTSILATADQEVSIHAARSVPDTYLDKLENVEIVVRPF
jgi:hypothetical protein